jgi:hypothetical protein
MDIPVRRKGWLCYDFKDKRIVPRHYTTRPGRGPLDTVAVEASAEDRSGKRSIISRTVKT